MNFDLPSDKKSDDEVMDSLLRLTAMYVAQKEDIDDASRNRLLMLIRKSDHDVYQRISKFMEAFTVYSFLKSDKDLRLKGVDVWRAEKERHKTEYLEQLGYILMFFDKKGWDLGEMEEELNSI
ncbi:MAG: hypothetical protein U9R60_01070 [Bacteroidota bacterium]|nr:hypothetical protein [Bacteroidota bacterium]